jgi:GT2 family glycosyltransferase
LDGHVTTIEALIVSYNARELLASCLGSIEQHMPDASVAEMSVRILDNGSSDGSPEMVADRFPWVSIERWTENRGFARANNHLAMSSRADYVMLLNPDTRWTEDLVEPLLDALVQTPRAVAAGPCLIWPDGRRQPSAQRFPTLAYELALTLQQTPYARLLRRLWDVEQVIAGIEMVAMEASTRVETQSLWATCWMMRRRDIKALGLFDERFVMYDEDLDFCWRMKGRGRTFVYEPRVRLVHVGGGSSTVSVKHHLTRRSRYVYYRLHHGRAAAFLYARALPAVLRLDATRSRLTSRWIRGHRSSATL